MDFISLPIVLDAVVKASVILAVTALGAVALRCASAAARHLVWSLGLLSALAAPALSVALPRWELRLLTIAAPAASSANSPAESLPPSGGSQPAATRSIVLPPKGGSYSDSPNALSVESPAARVPLSWTSIVFFAWLAGAAVILGRMFLGLAAVAWMS